MPKFPKPFYRKDRGLWYVQIRGRQHNLGRDEKAAHRKYHELMAKPEPINSEKVAGVIDGFLEWCQRNRERRTYEGYKAHLQSFLDSLPDAATLTVSELRPYHVHDWAGAHTSWGDTFTRNAMTAVQRAFSWAEKMGHIEKSPVKHLEKPTARRRENDIPEAHYRRMLELLTIPQAKDLITFAWETGARPHEIRNVEARHFDGAKIAIPPEEAKGRKRWRVIILNDTALEIAARLAKTNPEGPMFRNSDGKPWTAFATNCMFRRFKEKLGVKYGLVDFRHSFATRLLKNGVDNLTVSMLLGHADGAMLGRVYSHIDKAHDYLREQLERVNSPECADTKK